MKSYSLIILCFIILFTGVVNATTWNNYVINGSSDDWSAYEFIEDDNGIPNVYLYTTWSSTAMYFGLLGALIDDSRDFFVYLSTSLTGGTTEAVNWNVEATTHTLSCPMHYCLAVDSDTVKTLYEYSTAGSSWSAINYTGSVVYNDTGDSTTELSIPLSDLNISTNTSVRVLVFTQEETSNDVRQAFPTENGHEFPQVAFKYFYRIDFLGEDVSPSNLPHNWLISDFSVDNDNQGTHSGDLIKGFTPDNDMSNDTLYFDFKSAVGGEFKFIIDTNDDGDFDENDDYSETGGFGQDELREIQWEGQKVQQTGGTPFICVGNNTTYYVQIMVEDYNGNITFSSNVMTGVMGAWSLTGYVTGYVTAGGAPCSGAYIPRVEKEGSGGINRSAVVDNTGNFVMYGLSDATYDIYISSDPLASARIEEVSVSGTFGSDAGTANLIWGARVKGTVSDFYTGGPISNAYIRADGYFQNSISERTETDSSGDYTDQANPGDPYRISAEKSGYGTVKESRALSEGTTTQVDFILAYSGAIGGQVKYNGVPQNGYIVGIYKTLGDFYRAWYDFSDNMTQTGYDPVTDSSGTYTFTDLGAGVYVVAVYPSLGSADKFAATEFHTNIAVYENQETDNSVNPDVDFNLGDAAVISGLVQDGSGSPIENLMVFLSWTENDSMWLMGGTDSSGYYEIPSVSTSPDAYYMTVPQFNPESQLPPYQPVTIKPLPVTSTGTIVQNFTLKLPTSTISGNLINNCTNFSQGPWMIFAMSTETTSFSQNQTPDHISMSTSTGQYGILVSSSTGRYTVMAMDFGIFQIVARTFNVSSGTIDADLVIDTGPTISGKVYPNEAIPGDLSFIFALNEGYPYGGTIVGADGSYEIGFLPTDISTYTIMINLPGYTTGYRDNVSSNTTGNDIHLTPDPALDKEIPTISYIYPAIYSKLLTTATTIQATLSDGVGTGINASTVKLLVDGTPKSHYYNELTGKLTFYIEGLSETQHSIYIECKDSATPTALTTGLTWYFEVDFSLPTVTLFNAYDTDGNNDTNFSPNNGPPEETLRIEFNSSESGDYTLYIDSNNNGAYDEGLDVFVRSYGGPYYVDYNVAFTTETTVTIDWWGDIYDSNGNNLGNIDEGTWVIRLQVDDSYDTGSSSDGNVIESSVTVKVDRSTVQNSINSPPDSGIIYGPVFPVTYTLGEDSDSVDPYNTYLQLPGSSYVLTNPSDLGQGQHTVYLDGPAIGFTEGGFYSVELNSCDLAGNVRWAWEDPDATASPVQYMYPPGKIADLSAATSALEEEIDLTWTSPGADGFTGQLNGEFKIQHSSYVVAWSTTSADITISTTNATPLTLWEYTVTGLTKGTTYFFRIWTGDNFPNWSDISNGATNWAQVKTDTAPPANVTDLEASQGVSPGSVELTWTSPGDDDTTGVLNGTYRIQYSTGTPQWNRNNAQIVISTQGVDPGSLQSYTRGGLILGATYYFRLWTGDDVSNWSEISNGATDWAQQFSGTISTTTWKNYVIDGYDYDWTPENEIIGTETGAAQVDLYTTWSSTALYFAARINPSSSRDYFIYLSTSLTGGTTTAINWNSESSTHKLSYPMHYSFVIDSIANKNLYKYNTALSDWETTGWTGQIAMSGSEDILEVSIPLSDLDISTNTSVRVLVFTQDEISNEVYESFPTENDTGSSPVAFRYFYRMDVLGNGMIPKDSPHNWWIYDFSVDNDDEDTHSGSLTKNFTPNEDGSNDYVYFDFRSAAGWQYKFIIDTNNDGTFDENDDYSITDGMWGPISQDEPKEIRWDGRKNYFGLPMMCVKNNTTYYVQIMVRDFPYGNVTVSSNVALNMGASSLTGWISGNVNAGGTPLPGVEISDVDRQTGQESWKSVKWAAVSDESGDYELYGLSDGTYRVRASSAPYASTRRSNIVVSGTDGTSGQDINFIWGVRVKGTVTNFATGKPIKGANIYFNGYFQDGIYEYTSTDENGYYTDQVNPGSPYMITASKSGFANITESKSLVEGTTVYLDFAMTLPGGIKGVVKHNGVGMNDCTVRIYDSIYNFYDNQTVYSTSTYYDPITDSSGTYTTSSLTAGVYVVSVIPDYPNPFAACEHHTNISVFENNQTDSSIEPAVDFDLIDGAVISGLVQNSSGAPLENAGISLYWTNNDKGYTTSPSNDPASTDSSGYYQIPSVSTSPDAYYIVVRKPGEYVPAKIDPLPVTTTGTFIQNFVLQLPTATISGQLTNNTSIIEGPYSIFAVPAGTFIEGQQMPDYMATLSSPGSYGIPVSSSIGLYDIGVYPEDVGQIVATAVNVSSGSTGVNLIIDTGTTISGTVYRSGTNEPLSGVEVRAWNNGHIQSFIFGTPGDGTYELEYLNVNISTYTLEFIKDGYTTGYLTDVSSNTVNNDIYLDIDPAKDTQKPTISYIYPGINGKILSSATTVQVTLSDNGGTGVNASTVKLLVDGDTKLHYYNELTEKLTFYIEGLEEDQHSIYIECSDFAAPTLMSNLTWYFAVDFTPPTVTTFTAYDTDGNQDKNFSPNNGLPEETLRIEFNSSEYGDYTLYVDSNNNGAYDDGLDVFVRQYGYPYYVDYNVPFTTETAITIDWNGWIYAKNGFPLGDIPEGTWVLRLEIDDTYNTGSSSDGNVTESSVTVKVDRSTVQNYVDSPPDGGIIYGPVFPVTYTLGEDSYSIDPVYNTYLQLDGSSYVLNNPPDLGQGQHTVYLDGPAIGFTEGDSYGIELNSCDLAGNRCFADPDATASPVQYLYLPSAITCLSAIQGPRQGQIELTWTSPGDDGIVGNLTGYFRIDYSTDPDKSWGYDDYQVELSTVNCQPLTAFEKKVTGLTAGTTYFFRIWTGDEFPNWSDISNGATTWAMVDIIAPDAISNLTALTGSSDGDVDLQWTAPGDDGTIDVIADGSYKIKAATFVITSANFGLIDSNTPYTYVIEISTDIVSPLETHTLKVTGLYPGTTYFFAVRTRDEEDNWSVWPGTTPAVNSASFVPAEDNIPGQPQSPAINPATVSSIDIMWTSPTPPENINDFDKYWVFHATDPFNNRFDPAVVHIATIPWVSGTTTYTDTGLTSDTTYFYSVILLDTGDGGDGLFSVVNESPYSTMVSTKPIANPPMAPVDFTADVWTTSITWTWKDTSSNEDRFYLKFATSPASPTFILEVDTNVTTVDEINLSTNTAYGRYIAAYNSSGETLSDSATFYTLAVVPVAVGLSSVTINSICADWQPNSNPQWTEYICEISSDTDNFATISASSQTLNLSATFYSLVPNTTYWLQVKAVNGDGLETAYDFIGSTSSLASPPGLTALTFSNISENSIRADWTPANPAGTRYVLECSTVTTDGVVRASSETLNFYAQFSGFEPNTTHFFQVKAINNNEVDTAWTPLGSTHTLANIPGAISFGTVAEDSVEVLWADNGNPDWTVYELEASTGSNTAYELLWSGTGTVPVTHSGLTPNTTYYYQVMAKNLDGLYTSYNTGNSTHTLANDPGTLSFVAVYLTSATIHWENNGNSDSTVYEVSQSTDDFNLNFSTPVLFSVGFTTFTTTIALQQSTTNYFRIAAQNLDNIVSAGFSNTISTYVKVGARVWAAASTGDASLAANWSPQGVLLDDEIIIFDGSVSTQSCTWGVSGITISSLTVQDDYTGTIDVSTELDIEGDFTMDGGTFIAGNSTHTVIGDWKQVGGTFNPSAGTIKFEGGATGRQYITQANGSSFFNFISSGQVDVESNAVTLNSGIDIDGNLQIGWGRFDINSNTLHLAGNLTQSGGTTLIPTGTLVADGSLSQSLAPTNGTFDSLRIENTSGSGAEITSAVEPHIITGNFGMVSGARFNNINKQLEVNGNFISSGTFDNSFSTVTFAGSSDKYIWTNTAFRNVVINKSGGATVSCNSNIDIEGNLTISAGTFDMGTNNISISGVTNVNSGIWKLNSSVVTADEPITVNFGATLDMTDGSAELRSKVSLAINGGTLLANSQNQKITGSGGNTSISIDQGTVDITGLTLDLLDSDGLRFTGSASTINDLNDIKFTNIAADAVALNFEKITATAYTFSNIEFDDINITTNIAGSFDWVVAGNRYIEMTGASGQKRGFEHENDPKSIIFWSSPTAITSYESETKTSSSIEWRWDDVDDEVLYRVYTTTGNGGVVSPGWPSLSYGTTYWIETGLTPNTSYQTYVEAYNTLGVSTYPATFVSEWTYANTPTGLSVVETSSYSVKLTWGANSNPEWTDYQVRYSTDSGFNGYTDETLIKATTQTIDSLWADTSYYFRIKTINAEAVETSLSAATTQQTYPAPPAAPTGLTGVAISTTSIQWLWNITSGATYYQLYNAGDHTLSENLEGNGTTSWLKIDLSSNTPYSRYVKAGNISGLSGPSSTVDRYTLAYPPSGLNVVSVSSTTVDLSWQESGASKYRVERGPSVSGPWVVRSTETAVTFNETGLSGHTTYYYKVGAINVDDIPTTDFYLEISTALTKPMPAQLTGSGNSISTIFWTWSMDVIGGSMSADYYRVFMASSTDTPTSAVKTGQSDTETGLSINTAYGRCVRAYNASGDTLSPSATVYTLAAVPTNPTITDVYISSVTLNWSSNGNPSGTNYGVARALDSGFGTGVSSFTGIALTTYTVTELDDGTTYYFHVWAINGDNIPTDASVSVSTQTIDITAPARVTNVWAYDVENDTGGVVAVSWIYTEPADTKEYSIYYAYGVFDDTASAVGSESGIQKGTTYYEVTGLTAETTPYYFVVVPVDEDGNTYTSGLVSTGPVYAVNNTVGYGDDWTIEAGFNKDVRVEITPNTNIGVVINIIKPAEDKKAGIDTADDSAESQHDIVTDTIDDLKDTIVEFKGELEADVTIVLSYKGISVDSSIEDDLKIFELDEINNKWVLVSGIHAVDKINKTVSIAVSHFSIYRIFGAKLFATDLTTLKVYPNPYKPGATGEDAQFDRSEGIAFENLTGQATIRIFNIAGELVFEYEKNDSDNTYDWEAENNNNEKVASGLYIYFVTNDEGEKQKGKIGIIR